MLKIANWEYLKLKVAVPIIYVDGLQLAQWNKALEVMKEVKGSNPCGYDSFL